MNPPFRLALPPRVTTSVVVASPHSGRFYPKDFLNQTVLDASAIRSSEDAFMDFLVADAPMLGAPLLAAEYPRAWLDLNRNADELDPAVIEGVGRSVLTPRISSGLGVIPRVVSNGRAIYRGKLRRALAEARLHEVWHPYHACLEDLMGSAHEQFGEAVLLDFHSMPHEALDAVARPGQRRPEVVLGDRFGASARADLVDVLEDAFQLEGLSVSRNAPFAGAFITQHYGRPARGRHAIQVEIDRALYMDERTLRRTAEFDAVRHMVARVLSRVIGAAPQAMPLVAE